MKLLKYFAIMLIVWAADCYASEPLLVNVKTVEELIIRRIPSSVEFPVSVEPQYFDGHYYSEFKSKVVRKSALALKVLELLKEVKLCKTDRPMPDIRWSITVVQDQGRSNVTVYLGDYGDYLVLDNIIYVGSVKLGDVLRKNFGVVMK